MPRQTKKTYKELALEFKKTRNEKVYNELYAKMRPGLWSYVNKIVKDAAVADDIVSTTLTTVYLKIDQYNEAYQITTWAYRIAYNECIEQVRLTKEAINALPPMYRRFMVERFLNKKSYNDILDIMKKDEKGINLQTVKNRIFRGRRIVKKQLESMKVFSDA